MVKILGIVGSPRTQGNTYVMVNTALKSAKNAGAKVEMLELGDMKIETCVHGGECYELGSCVQEDDLNSIATAMHAADGIIFGSPAYQGAVPGLMKNMLDRVGRFVQHHWWV